MGRIAFCAREPCAESAQRPRYNHRSIPRARRVVQGQLLYMYICKSNSIGSDTRLREAGSSMVAERTLSFSTRKRFPKEPIHKKWRRIG